MKRNRRKRSNYKKWITTFTKAAVVIVLGVCLFDLQLSYILAFIGREQIAESLSSTIAETVIGVTIGYFFKALFETFFEKREERLKRNQDDPPPESNPEDEVVG